MRTVNGYIFDKSRFNVNPDECKENVNNFFFPERSIASNVSMF